MSTQATLITRSPITSPKGASTTVRMATLRRRLARLERRCAATWGIELQPHLDGETAHGDLAEIEQRIVELLLRSLDHDDVDSIVPEAERCADDLDQLTNRWSTTRAA